jgi:ribosome-associated protein
MIEITSGIAIDENEIQIDYVRSAGPGGQNVNKVASAAQLRFDVDSSPSLPDEVKRRLHTVARNRITAQGILIIEARRFRTQERNREDAIARLVALIFEATQAPKPRKRTKPSAAAQAERVAEKKRRSATKRTRRLGDADFD